MEIKSQKMNFVCRVFLGKEGIGMGIARVASNFLHVAWLRSYRKSRRGVSLEMQAANVGLRFCAWTL